MLLGHIGVGLAGKKIAPGVPLGTLVLAAQFGDLVWIVLTLTGVEHFRIVADYTLMSWYDMYDTPFSHGLAANVVFALAFGGIYFLLKKDLRSSLVLGVIVLSHWLLDFVSHRPDMVLVDKSWPLVGLELWRSYFGTVIVETGLYIVGLILYLSALKKRPKPHWLRPISFVLFCTFLEVCSLVLKPTGNVSFEIQGCGIMLALLIIVAYSADAQKRTSVSLWKCLLRRRMKHLQDHSHSGQ